MNWKKDIEKILKDGFGKNYINLIILALIGVLLLIASSYFKSPKAKTSSTMGTKQPNVEQQVSLSEKDSENVLKNDLRTVLQLIDGVGKVDVMIYFESGEEQIPAVNMNETNNTTNEKAAEGGERVITQRSSGSNVVMTNDGSGNQALILKKYKPRVTGVCVVAEGANKSEIKYLISKAVENLFNVPPSKVSVFPMKK